MIFPTLTLNSISVPSPSSEESMRLDQFIGSAFEIHDPQWLHAFWIIGLIALLGFFATRNRRKAARRFADEERVISLLGQRRGWIAGTRAVLLVLGLALIVGSIVRPRSNPHQESAESKGRDIVFLVDVSKSMLVRDVAPNRLERAKLWITDMVSQLKTDRVALVAFAGTSKIQSPLTTDRLFFDLALDELSPEVVEVGGTNIGDAIRRTMDLVFYDLEDSETATHRDIILITDGEDQESLPVDAASAAGAAGIRILALGIGSEAGAPVTDENNRPVRRNGRTVRSSLDSATLSEIATATPGGAYLEIGTGDIDLGQVYQDLIARGDQATIGTASVTRWDEQYSYALAPGLALILLEMILTTLGVRKEPAR
ncbi:MAG: VWA domain-containing protein [Phycisphaerales bacterium]|nr:VWA domain-containing protein [Phycisphaerales bacterium]